jgi:N4-(beta-N-acetylglucosaminyl)-L-asparaginase
LAVDGFQFCVAATWKFGRTAVAAASEVLRRGGHCLDAVEKGANAVELDPSVSSVGHGGMPNAAGVVEVDAAIMRGSDLRAGSVAALQQIRTPTSVARAILEEGRHVMLAGQGALAFALSRGFKQEDLLTPETRRRAGSREVHDTVGVLAIDRNTHMAAACSTSGTAWKLPGRVGDSPLIGGGLYVDDSVGAAVATGIGEEIMKVCGSFLVVELMRRGDTPHTACLEALNRIRNINSATPPQAAFIALRNDGEVAAASMLPGFSFALSTDGKIELVEAPHVVEP